MPGPTTTNYSWQLPDPAGANDYPGQMAILGQAIDTTLRGYNLQGLFSARPAAGTYGRTYTCTDSSGVHLGEVDFDNGTAWIQFLPSASNAIPTLFPVTTNTSGLTFGAVPVALTFSLAAGTWKIEPFGLVNFSEQGSQTNPITKFFSVNMSVEIQPHGVSPGSDYPSGWQASGAVPGNPTIVIAGGGGFGDYFNIRSFFIVTLGSTTSLDLIINGSDTTAPSGTTTWGYQGQSTSHIFGSGVWATKLA